MLLVRLLYECSYLPPICSRTLTLASQTIAVLKAVNKKRRFSLPDASEANFVRFDAADRLLLTDISCAVASTLLVPAVLSLPLAVLCTTACCAFTADRSQPPVS